MAAEIYAAGHFALHGLDGSVKSLLISLRASSRRWSVGARLTEGQIAAEDGEAGSAEGVGESDQERSIAVCSRAMGQDEAVCCGRGGLVEESANGDFG